MQFLVKTQNIIYKCENMEALTKKVGELTLLGFDFVVCELKENIKKE